MTWKFRVVTKTFIQTLKNIGVLRLIKLCLHGLTHGIIVLMMLLKIWELLT